MNKIIFTADAKAISDFECEEITNCYLDLLEGNTNGIIKVCNMLVITALRAKLHTTHRHLIAKIEWYYEDNLVDMDHNLRSNKLWQYDFTNLAEDYITELIDRFDNKDNDL